MRARNDTWPGDLRAPPAPPRGTWATSLRPGAAGRSRIRPGTSAGSTVRGIVLNYRDVTDEREHSQALRDIERRRQSLLEEIINAESEQRSRIAGELHDDTIQVMIASLFELDRSERHLRNGDVEAA